MICEKTYSLVLDATTLQYLIILVEQQGLHLHLMDVVTTYLYSSLENHIYMKIPKGFYLPNKANSKEGYLIKLKKPFYWLRQSERAWYNHLIEYLLKEIYRNDPFSSCIYMKISKNEFSIIIICWQKQNTSQMLKHDFDDDKRSLKAIWKSIWRTCVFMFKAIL